MNQIQVENQVDKIVMPDNLKVGLMVTEQRKKCASGDCTEEFYGLGFGQSPFHVLPELSKALSESADKGHYSAAEGILELRKAISEFNKRHFGLDVNPSRIVIGPGTKDIINTLFGMIKGDVSIPSWIGYRPQIHLLNKHFHTFFLKPEHDYKIQLEEFEEFVSKLHNQQHILVLNNPHNPTGALYTRKELENLTNICRKYNVLVLADEIYALDTYDVSQFTSMGVIYPEGAFVNNGLSKDRSAGGYRLGSCILPSTSSEKLASDYKKVAATVYTNVSTPIQYAAIKAYEQNQEIEQYITITRDIHRIMGTFLSEQWGNIEDITVTKPKDAFYFYADFNQLKPNLKRKNVQTSNQLGESLLSCPFHIAVVTGDACMLEPDDFGARIAFVDYDGKKTYDDYKNNKPKLLSDEIEFVKRNAPLMVRSTESLKEWVKFIKNN